MDRRRSSRAYLAAFVAVLAAAVATSGLAAADKPVTPLPDNPEPFFYAEFSPKKLSKMRSKPTPIRLDVSANLRANQKTGHLPALKELFFKLDKHMSLDLSEVPTGEEVPGCGLGARPPQSVDALRKICAPAVIGGGRMAVEVQFPDQPPIPVESQVLILNAGAKRGVTTLFLLARFTAPVMGWVVTTAKVDQIRERRYRMEVAASVPKIAGGAGSITRFAFSLKRGILSATCPDGRLNVHNRSVLADGTQLAQTAIRACTARETAR
jgi:hypothetical protein